MINERDNFLDKYRFETLLEPIIIRKTNRKMFVLDGNGKIGRAHV